MLKTPPRPPSPHPPQKTFQKLTICRRLFPPEKLRSASLNLLMDNLYMRSLFCMNESLYMAHTKYSTYNCMFTAPDAHSAYYADTTTAKTKTFAQTHSAQKPPPNNWGWRNITITVAIIYTHKKAHGFDHTLGLLASSAKNKTQIILNFSRREG